MLKALICYVLAVGDGEDTAEGRAEGKVENDIKRPDEADDIKEEDDTSRKRIIMIPADDKEEPGGRSFTLSPRNFPHLHWGALTRTLSLLTDWGAPKPSTSSCEMIQNSNSLQMT
jgi:hypothetical protein